MCDPKDLNHITIAIEVSIGVDQTEENVNLKSIEETKDHRLLYHAHRLLTLQKRKQQMQQMMKDMSQEKSNLLYNPIAVRILLKRT